jgi:Tol biopolymer transport system component
VRWGAILVVATACGRFDFAELDRAPGAPDAAAPIGDGVAAGDGGTDAPASCAWGTPVSVATLNSAGEDWEPAISPDGLTLVLGRQVTSMSPHLFMAHRAQLGDAFSAPVAILGTQTSLDAGPAWSPDGKTLYFVTDRDALQTEHLYTSAFTASTVSFAAPIRVSSLAIDMVGPTISATDRELFYNDPSSVASMRWATRPDPGAPWTDQGVITELTSGHGDGWPSLSPDGLTIYFESNRDLVTASIYSATRPAIGATWTNIAKVSELDAGTEIGDPDISPDGLTIYFAATRTGGMGFDDIYVATRACL